MTSTNHGMGASIFLRVFMKQTAEEKIKQIIIDAAKQKANLQKRESKESRGRSENNNYVRVIAEGKIYVLPITWGEKPKKWAPHAYEQSDVAYFLG